MNASCRAAIGRWLLTSGIQIPAGPERGGVAGWLNEQGHPEFVYTEVTGYYLTAMAFLLAVSCGEDKVAILNANRALEWLLRCCGQGKVPPTRRYLCGHNHDWRSRVLFAFDLAMTLRGVAAVQGLVPEDQRRPVQEVLVNGLLRFCKPAATLIPFLPHHTVQVTDVPVRWSTTPGPYQLKIAASLLLSLNSEMRPELEHASRKIHSQWCSDLRGHGLTGQWHADLYFIEGLILFGLQNQDTQAWRMAAESYQALVDRCGDSPNSSKEIPPSVTATRSDVVAQLLRAGCVLECNGYLKEPIWAERLDRLALSLKQFVNDDGAVSFRPIHLGDQTHWNTWCALFAYQALYFYETRSRGDKLEDRWVQLLI